jgi:hypothetical protein
MNMWRYGDKILGNHHFQRMLNILLLRCHTTQVNTSRWRATCQDWPIWRQGLRWKNGVLEKSLSWWNIFRCLWLENCDKVRVVWKSNYSLRKEYTSFTSQAGQDQISEKGNRSHGLESAKTPFLRGRNGDVQNFTQGLYMVLNIPRKTHQTGYSDVTLGTRASKSQKLDPGSPMK